jgi:hypothetical protein
VRNIIHKDNCFEFGSLPDALIIGRGRAQKTRQEFVLFYLKNPRPSGFIRLNGHAFGGLISDKVTQRL